jgi:acetyl esterase/lipase
MKNKCKRRVLFCCAVPLFFAGCALSNSLYSDTDSNAQENLPEYRTFIYDGVEHAAWAIGQKEVWEKDPQSLAEHFLNLDQSARRVPPAKTKRDFAVSETLIEGSSWYLISPRKNPRTDKAVLYLHGGGFLFEADDLEWDFVLSIVRELSVPVCVPVYPIFPETDPERLLSFVARSYELLRASCPGAEIIVAGVSAGADLTLGLCHYISGGKAALPMPGKLICISPAMTLETDPAILAAMREIDKHDAILSINMLESLPELLDFLKPPATMYNAPFYGDFSAFPPVYLFSGTSDIFYPQMKPFVERVRGQGKYIEFYTGHRMMHGWAILPFTPETRIARERVFEIIAEEADA